MAEEKQCVLVIVGAEEYGRKELLAMTDGFRESTQSWRELLLDLKRRGLKQDPKLAIGDGALGFWTALREVFATTREQRCWVHKTMNVLNAMPKSMQAKAKGHLHDIWQAETKAKANAAFDFFVETYGVKWDKAVTKLVKDREALLTYYDYPAEHWKHIRTSNPIESTFATVRHRTKRTKGCLSRKTGLAMAFKLMMSAQKKWRKLDGQNRLPEIIQGLSSATGSANFKPPPDHASPTFAHISGRSNAALCHGGERPGYLQIWCGPAGQTGWQRRGACRKAALRGGAVQPRLNRPLRADSGYFRDPARPRPGRGWGNSTL